MPQISTATSEIIYFVAYGIEDTVHYGSIEPGGAVATGQPNMEEFDTAAEMARRAFGLNPDVFRQWDEAGQYEIGDFVIIDSDLYEKGVDGFELIEAASAT